MEKTKVEINRLLLAEDILSCINVINAMKSNTGNVHLIELKKDGKPTLSLTKAKAATVRLNILLDYLIKA